MRKLLAELLDGEGLRADQIAVLTPCSASRSTLADGLQLGNRTLAWRDDTDPNTVRVSSIHGFKGLERGVIILAETDELRNSRAPIDMLCYVALSRAKHHVIVIGDLPDPVLASDAAQTPQAG